jgi:MoxR-like ATPase
MSTNRQSVNSLPRAEATMELAVAADYVRRLIANISRAFLGKEETVTQAVLALMAGGHVLVEDIPGLGKTLLAKALAKSLSADFKRIQFTADLLPSDVTGVTVYAPENQQFSFRKGPVFAHILLGDEINRATPRTQSSLLEAMEEHCVTVDGISYPLPWPFFVMATQNPIELEGTYPLPFAQMDRFMLRLAIGYLDKLNEIQMLRDQRQSDPLSQVSPLLDGECVLQIQSAVRRVPVADALLGYLVDIVRATRQTESLEYGASPRGSLDIQTYSQALALLAGRDFVLPDDIKRGARVVLPHRLIGKKGTRSATINGQALIAQLVETVPVPV